MKEHKITNILLLLSLAILLFGSGFKLGEYRINSANPAISKNQIVNEGKKSNIDMTLFWDAWNKLQEKYIDKKRINPQKMVYGAIKGMVSSLDDPYTFFLTPDENKVTKQDLGGKFEGIGAQLGLKDSRIVVIAPLKQSPAEKAGVKAGDYINKVEDQSTKGWTLPQAVEKIRGPKGTKVKLTLERNAKEFVLEIIRDEINVASVELSYENKNGVQLIYLKLNQFGDNTNDEWNTAVDEISQKWENRGIKGMVLDLRNNPGGYLEGSVYVASEFLPEGKTVVKQESTTSKNPTYSVDRKGRLLDIPMVVIINKGSASASEILAGALRDYKRAKLVGEKSFGKGSVQEAVDLKGGAGLHMTVAKWILPNGDWINSKGIQPDVQVENKVDEKNTLTRQTDSQLEKAIELLVQ